MRQIIRISNYPAGQVHRQEASIAFWDQANSQSASQSALHVVRHTVKTDRAMQAAQPAAGWAACMALLS